MRSSSIEFAAGVSPGMGPASGIILMVTTTRRCFADLWNAWPWRPIRNCPGRFSLAIDERRLPISELVGDVQIQLHRVSAARDPVLIAQLRDGGLISYSRSDGTYTHTLNTPVGFERKLHQLGIASMVERDDDIAP